MKTNKLVKGLLAAGLIGLAGSVNAADLVIDTFETSQAVISDITTGDGGVGSSVSGSGILGGERDIFVEKYGVSATNGFSGSQMLVSPTGRLSFNNSVDDYGLGIIQWDGNDGSSSLSYGLGANLSSYTNLEVGVFASDAGFDFLVGIYTDATNWTEITLAAAEVTSPETFLLDLNGFINPLFLGIGCQASGGTGPISADVLNISCGSDGMVSLSEVGAIQVIFNPTGSIAGTALDLSIDNFEAVPEPSSLALLGLGLVGVAAARRKSVR